MKGTVLTDPIPLDNGQRIEFKLLQEGTQQVVHCCSSLQFAQSHLMKRGDTIELEGKCVNQPKTDTLARFVFVSFIKESN
jgi:hypothetical protein